MLKTIVIAAALVTAGAGAVYAQKTMSPNDTTVAPTQRNMDTGAKSRSEMRATTLGATQFLTTLPAGGQLVSHWYDKNVYDPSDNKLGEIKDMMMDTSGQVDAVIVSVGGFLGIGEKDVAVPFNAIQATERNKKWWLTMNTTKDALKSATGFKFDRSRNTWTMAADY